VRTADSNLAAFVLRLVFVLLVERHGFPLNDTFFYHSIDYTAQIK
jgi:hypothetical protein